MNQKMILWAAPLALDLSDQSAHLDGRPIELGPKVFALLRALMEAPQRVVTKEELFDAVWGGKFVGEAALTSRIKAARRALGDDGESQRYIRTVRGRGYQFVATVIGAGPPATSDREGASAVPAPPEPAELLPQHQRHLERDDRSADDPAQDAEPAARHRRPIRCRRR